jgi:hypothetical protein
MTAESELFLDLNGDLFGFPEEEQDTEPSTDIPPLLLLSLPFSESIDKKCVTKL